MPICDYGHDHADVRRLSIGGGAGVQLCHEHYTVEADFRRDEGQFMPEFDDLEPILDERVTSVNHETLTEEDVTRVAALVNEMISLMRQENPTAVQFTGAVGMLIKEACRTFGLDPIETGVRLLAYLAAQARVAVRQVHFEEMDKEDTQ